MHSKNQGHTLHMAYYKAKPAEEKLLKLLNM